MTNTVNDTELEKIVEGCRAQDRVMQANLYYLSYGAIYNTVARYISDEGDREDTIQETYVKAFARIHQLKEDKVVVGWICRIAVNQCIDNLKKYKKLQLLLNANLEQTHNVREEPDDELGEMDDVTMDDVNDVLSRLPVGYRTVFLLYAVENYSHKEIAQHLGTSESNSKTQYMRAKIAIKNLVKQKLACKRMR